MSASKPTRMTPAERCKLDPLWDINPEAAKKTHGTNQDGSPLKSNQKKGIPPPLVGNGVLGLSTSGPDFAKSSKFIPFTLDMGSYFSGHRRHPKFKHLSSAGNRRVAQGVRARRGNYKMAKTDTGRTKSPELRMAKGRKSTPATPKAPNPGNLETSGLGRFKANTFYRERTHTFKPQEASSFLNGLDLFYSQSATYSQWLRRTQ